MKALLVLLLTACGQSGVEDTRPAPVTAEQRLELHALVDSTLPWAQRCGQDGYLCEGHSDGDTTLFAGLVGHCGTVYASLDSDGRLWRSPDRVGIETVDSASRDMVLGLLSCLVTDPDVEAAERFLAYLQTNDYKLCQTDSDGRCTLSYVRHRTVWGIMKRIWERLGLETSWEMEQADYGDDTTLVTSANFTPLGYQLHLVSVQLYLRQLLDSETSKTTSAVRALTKRQPGNPWYAYLRYGSNFQVAESLLTKCPKTRPANPKQWAWQRDIEEKAWEDSAGWDCLFLASLLLGAPVPE